MPFAAVNDVASLRENLGERAMAGFGGVAEYGITVRWDKNYLKMVRLLLERRGQFSMFGGVRFGGTVASVCPSTAHQIALSLLQSSADGYVMEPPAFQLHLWHGGRLVSHTVPIGDFGGTQPFA